MRIKENLKNSSVNTNLSEENNQQENDNNSTVITRQSAEYSDKTNFSRRIDENDMHLKNIVNYVKYSDEENNKEIDFKNNKINELLAKFYDSLSKIYSEKSNKINISNIFESVIPQKEIIVNSDYALFDIYVKNIALKRIDLIAKLQRTNLKFYSNLHKNNND